MNEIINKIIEWVNSRTFTVLGEKPERILALDTVSNNQCTIKGATMPEIYVAYPVGIFAGLWLRICDRETAAQQKQDDVLRSIGYAVYITNSFEGAQVIVCDYLDAPFYKMESAEVKGRYNIKDGDNNGTGRNRERQN